MQAKTEKLGYFLRPYFRIPYRHRYPAPHND